MQAVFFFFSSMLLCAFVFLNFSPLLIPTSKPLFLIPHDRRHLSDFAQVVIAQLEMPTAFEAGHSARAVCIAQGRWVRRQQEQVLFWFDNEPNRIVGIPSPQHEDKVGFGG